MNKVYTVLFLLLGLSSCKDRIGQKNQDPVKQKELVKIIETDYELYKPSQGIQAVLILFGGYPEVANDIKREFKILENARDSDIAVILMNYNQKLWLEENEKNELASKLQDIIEKNQLPTDSIFIGGFSSGGVISLLISNYIVGMKEFYIDPKGVFIIDSPIDLSALYFSSEKNMEREFSEVSVQESTWLLEYLGNQIGDPAKDIKKYDDKSVFTSSTNNTSNLNKLKNTKIRFYTEPDTLWWKKNRMADVDQMNSFYIKKLYNRLKEQGYPYVEYIPTKNKGYRANGERHPHSWSIVDKQALIQWILE